MTMKTIIRACLLGISFGAVAFSSAQAETLSVLSGTTSSPLSVPMNRAVIVESDAPFTDLSIANPGIADITALSDRTIYLLGKLPGRTTMTILGGDGKLISNVEVQVTPDIAEFKERLKQILPGENIEVRTANDGIVLSGTVTSMAKLDRALDLAQRYAPERVSNLMSVGGTQQVMLKVRFAEMSRSVSKNLSGSIGFVNSAANATAGETGTFLLGDNSPTGSALTAKGDSVGALKVGASIGGLEMAVILEALESKGAVRTLAEPNLTALSGQQASFLAGGEYPIPVSQTNERVTVEYKPFGVSLAFTPRVVDGDVVNLEIQAEVSGIDPSVSLTTNGFSLNAFRTRRTSTTVEMRDGDSFAIAGLLQDDFSDMNSQVPWLGDIPVLGALFRSADYQRQQSELVIIVTPHLVTPTRGEALALPTDRVRPPSEAELFLFGKTEKGPKSGAAAEVAKQDFSGSYGYVME